MCCGGGEAQWLAAQRVALSRQKAPASKQQGCPAEHAAATTTAPVAARWLWGVC
tara:strand:- start:2095 stop:2256 length:162 start_codon:yes stop_codon:yes gene_type:complete